MAKAVTGDRVILDHGDLTTAMRASLSAPGVFSPVEAEGRMLPREMRFVLPAAPLEYQLLDREPWIPDEASAWASCIAYLAWGLSNNHDQELLRASIAEDRARGGWLLLGPRPRVDGASRWQNSGKPRSYCGHSPCTTKENGRGPHCWLGTRSGERSDVASQNEGDHERART